jgi:hypothetical protein
MLREIYVYTQPKEDKQEERKPALTNSSEWRDVALKSRGRDMNKYPRARDLIPYPHLRNKRNAAKYLYTTYRPSLSTRRSLSSSSCGA